MESLSATLPENKIIHKNNTEFTKSQVNTKRPTLAIATPKEFDFRQCLKYLGRSSQEKLHVIAKGSVYKLVKFRNQPILFKLGGVANQTIRVRFLNSDPDSDILQFIRNYVSEWFDLGTELAPFYGMASKDPILKNLVQRYYGLRIIRIHDLFQALCWAILGQQINLTFAYTLYRRFIEDYGEKFDYQNSTYWRFPRPDVIAEVTVAELMKLQLTGKKAEYIIGIAEQIKDGDLCKESLAEKCDFQDAQNRLLEIRGVGPWTANYVLLRCLGYRSAFPIGDIGLHNAIKKQLDLREKPGIEEIRDLALGWKNWEAYATFYLYASFLG